MKPFNLSDALAGKPVVTRNGRTVSKVVLVDETLQFPLVAVINGKMFAHDRQGQYFTTAETENDLFMASTKKSVWVNVYDEGGKLGVSKVKYDTQEECLRNITRKGKYIKTIEITNE